MKQVGSSARIARRLTPALAALLLPWGAPLRAQQTGEDHTAEVRAAVDRLFDGMRERDTSKLSSAFHAEARLYGLGPDGSVRVMPASEFVAGIARAPAGLLLDEVLGEVEIRIDGPLASVWTYYDFFAGENFSHCGYNAFQLLKTGGEWRVVSITDSRRRENCRQERRPRP